MDAIGKFVICRTRDQGVVCGYLKLLVPQLGGLAAAEITEARQVHYWADGANTLFEMSLHGCGTARISEPVETAYVFGVCGVLPCTQEAQENLSQSRWNESFRSSGSRPSAKARRG